MQSYTKAIHSVQIQIKDCILTISSYRSPLTLSMPVLHMHLPGIRPLCRSPLHMQIYL